MPRQSTKASRPKVVRKNRFHGQQAARFAEETKREDGDDEEAFETGDVKQDDESEKDEEAFFKVCALINFGHTRKRKDGIIEYIISRQEEIMELIKMLEPYVVMKKQQMVLMKKIILTKQKVETKKDFEQLINLIDQFRELNYSKKRKKRTLTP